MLVAAAATAGLGATVAVLTVPLRHLVSRGRRAAHAVAVTEERRRIARDLHDGLAQELAFIAAQARRLDDDERLRSIATAAERALDEARAAISALSRHAGEPLDVAIDTAARDVGGRLGVDVDLDLDRTVQVPPSAVEALARVVRESMGNAVRHGSASRVAVRLESGPPARLTVSDDGTGFDVDAPRRPGSHGIVSMTERAAAVGGRVRVRSRPGHGTVVEVVLS